MKQTDRFEFDRELCCFSLSLSPHFSVFLLALFHMVSLLFEIDVTMLEQAAVLWDLAWIVLSSAMAETEMRAIESGNNEHSLINKRNLKEMEITNRRTASHLFRAKNRKQLNHLCEERLISNVVAENNIRRWSYCVIKLNEIVKRNETISGKKIAAMSSGTFHLIWIDRLVFFTAFEKKCHRQMMFFLFVSFLRFMAWTWCCLLSCELPNWHVQFVDLSKLFHHFNVLLLTIQVFQYWKG